MNKRQLLRSIRSGYARFSKLLASLDPAQLSAPGTAGEWSGKDTLAHILVHEERMLRWMDERLAGRLPSGPQPYGLPAAEIDELNRCIYEENRDRPLDDILACLGQAHARTLGLVRAADEKDLTDPSRFHLSGGEALWEAVAANTYQHYEEHARDLQPRPARQ